MKQVTKERTTTEKYTAYVATDGTEFRDQEQCKLYEASALGVLRGKIKHLIIEDDMDAQELMGICDDSTVTAVEVPSERDMDNVLQWLYLECPWYAYEGNEQKKEKLEKIVRNAYANGDLLLVGKDCEGNCYVLNTRQHYVDELNSIGKSSEEKEEFNNEG